MTRSIDGSSQGDSRSKKQAANVHQPSPPHPDISIDGAGIPDRNQSQDSFEFLYTPTNISQASPTLFPNTPDAPNPVPLPQLGSISPQAAFSSAISNPTIVNPPLEVVAQTPPPTDGYTVPERDPRRPVCLTAQQLATKKASPPIINPQTVKQSNEKPALGATVDHSTKTPQKTSQPATERKKTAPPTPLDKPSTSKSLQTTALPAKEYQGGEKISDISKSLDKLRKGKEPASSMEALHGAIEAALAEAEVAKDKLRKLEAENTALKKQLAVIRKITEKPNSVPEDPPRQNRDSPPKKKHKSKKQDPKTKANDQKERGSIKMVATKTESPPASNKSPQETSHQSPSKPPSHKIASSSNPANTSAACRYSQPTANPPLQTSPIAPEPGEGCFTAVLRKGFAPGADNMYTSMQFTTPKSIESIKKELEYEQPAAEREVGQRALGVLRPDSRFEFPTSKPPGHMLVVPTRGENINTGMRVQVNPEELKEAFTKKHELTWPLPPDVTDDDWKNAGSKRYPPAKLTKTMETALEYAKGPEGLAEIPLYLYEKLFGKLRIAAPTKADPASDVSASSAMRSCGFHFWDHNWHWPHNMNDSPAPQRTECLAPEVPPASLHPSISPPTQQQQPAPRAATPETFQIPKIGGSNQVTPDKNTRASRPPAKSNKRKTTPSRSPERPATDEDEATWKRVLQMPFEKARKKVKTENEAETKDLMPVDTVIGQMSRALRAASGSSSLKCKEQIRLVNGNIVRDTNPDFRRKVFLKPPQIKGEKLATISCEEMQSDAQKKKDEEIRAVMMRLSVSDHLHIGRPVPGAGRGRRGHGRGY